MPLYTYRREDGTTFEIRQSFSDAALMQDPISGQKVSRVVQNTGVIFKGSGFYKNDNKSSAKSNGSTTSRESKESESAKPVETAKTAETPAASASAPAPSAAAAD